MFEFRDRKRYLPIARVVLTEDSYPHFIISITFYNGRAETLSASLPLNGAWIGSSYILSVSEDASTANTLFVLQH